jgi:ribulose-5-phosphate 4-epimerase/fuculose-1-phosphate aldolase
VRQDLAACYRLVARRGWTDTIYTHSAARVPGEDGAFLLNCYGLAFEEVTASSLVKVDFSGRILDGSSGPVDPLGVALHGALLEARPDVNCTIHTHSRTGAAVSAQKCGLLPISQSALYFHGFIGYHDYEGPEAKLDSGTGERARLAADLGSKSALVLRNHGLVTVGSSVAAAFLEMEQLELACQIQLMAVAGGQALVYPPIEVAEATAAFWQRAFIGVPKGQTEWKAFLRLLDRTDADFRN